MEYMIKTREVETAHMLQVILKEVRLLRNEPTLFFPQDDLKGYAHPERIKRSYRKAVRRYPPLAT
ncbi:hypothetical protein A3C91_00035 [Candidatus Azambacteria bacterium RIFCSPHIGHO2_02_FULL_52_12]|uniref:Uncharacterized protein n=1 Tax=Candidatus Azambacteria bacterium RIFCSPLOWO2_01_FULL_46_25 TaxID=1797298 RepID=A0A1F5BUS6_9BACT|nr:MAG: hypothetical protein A3C91_00035 [Candidatus Azambacteria bacterium RIFCSPHIGHO2_02_FULL_52_12]OGD34341.1 MAG: hypothetical protein A2988_02325 [Candidatus Azambacteria bacterium RIFCSPLOWO2_01_FULL_46_25]OGD37381.1 MAG: hypothetical protein A2850_01560 [Candidatus Azambacteria bacterium RIFCSPHIGHO2_01_FULL_51_74]